MASPRAVRTPPASHAGVQSCKCAGIFAPGGLPGPVPEPARANDRHATLRLAPVPASALYLADRGYFCLETLQTLTAPGSFFLSRLPVRTAVFLDTGERVELGRLAPAPTPGLARPSPSGSVTSSTLPAVPAGRVRSRGSPPRWPPAGAGGCSRPIEPSLITNTPASLLQTQEVLVLARVRWQIELLFKLWKQDGLARRMAQHPALAHPQRGLRQADRGGGAALGSSWSVAGSIRIAVWPKRPRPCARRRCCTLNARRRGGASAGQTRYRRAPAATVPGQPAPRLGPVLARRWQRGCSATCPVVARWCWLGDETSLQQRLKVLAVSLAYRGRAIPLAGQLITTLLTWVAAGLRRTGDRCWFKPTRGIGTSPELLRAIDRLRWFYLVRRHQAGAVAGGRGTAPVSFARLVSQPGDAWRGQVAAFKQAGWISCWAQGRWQPRARRAGPMSLWLVMVLAYVWMLATSAPRWPHTARLRRELTRGWTTALQPVHPRALRLPAGGRLLLGPAPPDRSPPAHYPSTTAPKSFVYYAAAPRGCIDRGHGGQVVAVPVSGIRLGQVQLGDGFVAELDGHAVGLQRRLHRHRIAPKGRPTW